MNNIPQHRLAHLARTPQGQDQYRAMSVADRLAILQQPGLGPLTPEDERLLQLLRPRREREAALSAAMSRTPQPAPEQPGFFARLFSGRDALNDALRQP